MFIRLARSNCNSSPHYAFKRVVCVEKLEFFSRTHSFFRTSSIVKWIFLSLVSKAEMLLFSLLENVPNSHNCPVAWNWTVSLFVSHLDTYTLSARSSVLSVSELKTSSVKGHFSNDTTLAEMNGYFFHIPESICHITVRINCPPKIPQERMNLDEASLDIPFSLISQVEDNILEAALN